MPAVSIVVNDEGITSHLNSRASLDLYLMNLIGRSFKTQPFPEQNDGVNIELPHTISKQTRYFLHRYTTDGFEPTSKDHRSGNRVMTINLSKEYVSRIMKNYIPIGVASSSKPKSDRQIMFDKFIEFINATFPNEMTDYINNI